MSPHPAVVGPPSVTLLFGTIFSVTGRIWMRMVAHASFDVAAVAIIYWDLETRVAHLVIMQVVQ